MTQRFPHRGRLAGALILIGLGVLFLLHNLDLFHLGKYFSRYWPSILILIGLLQLFAGRRGSPVGPFILILIGIILQAHKLDLLWWHWHDYWPVLLILAGLWIIFRPRRHGRDKGVNSDRLDSFAMLSGIEKTVQSEDFKGGEITVILGGGKIDLRSTHSRQTEMLFNVTVILGGLEIIVPQDWSIEVDVTPILGGMEDERRHVPTTPREKMPTLRISGSVILGGISIKD